VEACIRREERLDAMAKGVVRYTVVWGAFFTFLFLTTLFFNGVVVLILGISYVAAWALVEGILVN
jgi:hypothetical protein